MVVGRSYVTIKGDQPRNPDLCVVGVLEGLGVMLQF